MNRCYQSKIVNIVDTDGCFSCRVAPISLIHPLLLAERLEFHPFLTPPFFPCARSVAHFVKLRRFHDDIYLLLAISEAAATSNSICWTLGLSSKPWISGAIPGCSVSPLAFVQPMLMCLLSSNTALTYLRKSCRQIHPIDSCNIPNVLQTHKNDAAGLVTISPL